jgi:hypothetical protein
MASGIAKSTRVGLAEIDRQILPPTERHTIADMLELVAGMGLMARPAGSAVVFFIDAQEM